MNPFSGLSRVRLASCAQSSGLSAMVAETDDGGQPSHSSAVSSGAITAPESSVEEAVSSPPDEAVAVSSAADAGNFVELESVGEHPTNPAKAIPNHDFMSAG